MSNNNTSGLNSPDYGIVRLPAKANSDVKVRFAPLTARDNFDPSLWHTEQLAPDQANTDWYSIDLNGLQLPDGTYEYEFVLDGRDSEPVADPFADEITRFGGYRGIFRIVGGQRWRHPFSWDDEFADNVELADNHELVIYEMPMRWMESAPEKIRQVGLGTFEKVVFAHLDTLRQLGINAVELLPVQDSADTFSNFATGRGALISGYSQAGHSL
jgi:1,4-alpha-glucan branching enzyme